ncbi:MAG: polyphenol oxidase family protein [Gemmatimonadetes bacterium]|nr:polyphenol oxidase family protein [Gemmatimonadota bacterium]
MLFHEFRSSRLSGVPRLFHVVYGKPLGPPEPSDASIERNPSGNADARNEAAARRAFPSHWRNLPVARVSQVHGTELTILPCAEDGAADSTVVPAANDREADGLVAEGPGALLRIVVADCMPVFLVDPARRRSALVHAGWRGLAAGIIERSLQALAAGGTVASDLLVWIGPHIGPDAYEVGPEVIGAFPGRPPVSRPGRGDRAFLDLYETARTSLLAAGVPDRSIEERPACTRSDDRLFSHRAGDTGRNVAFLGFAA